jgi:hypothetical protein
MIFKIFQYIEVSLLDKYVSSHNLRGINVSLSEVMTPLLKKLTSVTYLQLTQ